MQKESCWVWFKGGLKETGIWKSGFTFTTDEKPGVIIQSPTYVTCRVPEWRISKIEPADKHIGPEIPSGSTWKII